MKNIYNLKSFYTHLLKNKLYTSIEIFGFSVSLIFVFFIGIYTVQELSTDKFQTKADRIFIVGNEDRPTTAAAIAYKLKERYPEIEKVCPVVPSGSASAPISVADRKLNASVMFADSTFFDLFSFKLLEGDPNTALVSNNNVVISQSFAKKVFGSTTVLGERIQVGDSATLIISGVVENLLNSALPESDIILPWRLMKHFNNNLDEYDLANAGSTVTFVLAHKDSDFHLKADNIKDWFKTFYWFYKREIAKEVRIESLADYYMTGWSDENSSLRTGDRSFVLILMFVGILILIFAILNYINLSIAQSGYRYKEMAMRRLLGSSRKELILRLILESTSLVLISVLVSTLLTLSGKTFVNELLDTNLDFSLLYSPIWLSIQFVLILFVGCLSGWLPAFIISAVEPIEIVRGSFRRKTKMVFSKIFIVFQNLITIIMLSASLIMILQINHLIEAPLGFNSKNIYDIYVDGIISEDQIHTFRNELRTLPNVKRVGFTNGSPTSGSNNNTVQYNNGGKKINIGFQEYSMDKECFEILGLNILQDNQLSGEGKFVNTEALRQMNLPKDANSFTVDDNTKINIAGIISDFHEGNILDKVPPILFSYFKPNETGWFIMIEIQGDPFKTQKEIAVVYERISGGLSLYGSFMDKKIEDTFQSQIRLAKIISVFTGIAILISILGLIAMSTYFIQQKEKEIAIRKVFGSTNQRILIQLVRTFLMYVLIAFIIATPIVYYFMGDWLAAYSYRIDLSAWIFLVVGFFSALVSFVVVVFQSWRASNSNPVKNLKSE